MAHLTHPKQEPLAINDPTLLQFIADVEGRDFRTDALRRLLTGNDSPVDREPQLDGRG